MEGVCVAIRRAPLGGHQRIRLMDESGTAHDLLLARRQKFLIGNSYRIYEKIHLHQLNQNQRFHPVSNLH